MRKNSLFCALSIVVIWLSSSVVAQDNGIFSGQGVRFPETKKPLSTKHKWPKLLDFSKDESATPSTNPFSGMFARKTMPERRTFETPVLPKPRFDWFKKKTNEIDGGGQVQPLSGLAELFPKRDPNQPSILEQMNAKSKNFIDRTTGWTQRRNQKLRDKSFSTWDTITKDLRSQKSELDRAITPAQPPVRTAEALGKPRVRF